MISVDRNSGVSLYRQIYETARDTIIDGGYRPGEKLPSIRCLADELGVARNTVDEAYRQLVAEGYIDGKPKAGFIVCDVSADALGGATTAPTPLAIPRMAPDPKVPAGFCDLRYYNLVGRMFPREAWRSAYEETLFSLDEADNVSYTNEAGEPRLRRQIADYLVRARGVRCVPEQVVITSGTQQSVARICTLLKGLQGERPLRMAIEDPCWDGIRRAVSDSGAQVDLVRADADEERYLADVAASDASAIYCTPSHQLPMGRCMGVSFRTRLLGLAYEHDAYVVEDDYDSEYRYDVRPMPSISAIDRRGHVVYLGTFSKILSPALRMSYMVLPEPLLERHCELFSLYHCTVPRIEQLSLATFMERGEWDRHIRRMVASARKRHALLLDCLREKLGALVEPLGQDAGLHVLLRVHNGMGQDELVSRAYERGVLVGATRPFWADPDACPENLVLLGFSAADEATIERGVELLRQAWEA